MRPPFRLCRKSCIQSYFFTKTTQTSFHQPVAAGLANWYTIRHQARLVLGFMTFVGSTIPVFVQALSVCHPIVGKTYIGAMSNSDGFSHLWFPKGDRPVLSSVAMKTSDTMPAPDRLAVCSSAVRLWFFHNGLQLNAEKSEVVILGTGHQLPATANITAVEVAGSNLIVHDRLEAMGVTTDSHLRFDCHANNVARASNYHTRALRHVHSLLTDDVAQTVACSIVASPLDYCNALLHGAPAATTVKLQRAQNNVARVVCQRGGSTDAPLLRRSLH